MVQQHLDGGCQLGVIQLVDSIEDPNCFSEGQQGDPSAVFDKSIGCGGLARVVTGDKADEDVGINGAHGVYERSGEGLL